MLGVEIPHLSSLSDIVPNLLKAPCAVIPIPVEVFIKVKDAVPPSLVTDTLAAGLVKPNPIANLKSSESGVKLLVAIKSDNAEVLNGMTISGSRLECSVL